jgi:hypothetical protein
LRLELLNRDNYSNFYLVCHYLTAVALLRHGGDVFVSPRFGATHHSQGNRIKS